MAKKKLIPEIIPQSIHPIFKKHFCYSLSKAGVLYRSVLEESLNKYGLVPPQGGILHILAHTGDYNQNSLGQEMNIDKASMVKFIDGLEKMGLLKRTVDPNDRRAKLLSLTAKGKKTQQEIISRHQALEKEIFKSFTTKEKEVLRDLMPKVLCSVLEYLNTKKV